MRRTPVLSDLLSADWLYDESTGRVAYAGQVTGRYPSGTTWRTTRRVAELVAAEQERLRQVEPTTTDHLFFAGDVLVHYTPTTGERWLIAPDSDGLYEMPGWTWYEVQRDRVDVVHSASPRIAALVTPAVSLTVQDGRIVGAGVDWSEAIDSDLGVDVDTNEQVYLPTAPRPDGTRTEWETPVHAVLLDELFDGLGPADRLRRLADLIDATAAPTEEGEPPTAPTEEGEPPTACACPLCST